MEELARMVAASMARHGCDTSIDHRRLNWSPWFRCELNVDLLLVPSAPGIFALAEEVIPGAAPEAIAKSPETEASATTSSSHALNVSASFDVCEHLPGSEHRPSSARMQAGRDHSRRLLAAFEIAETNDLGAALLRLFAPGSALRDRLRSGSCFARFTPVADAVQRRAAAASLREWLVSAATTSTSNLEAGALPVGRSSAA
jgi:hypothetical protein